MELIAVATNGERASLTEKKMGIVVSMSPIVVYTTKILLAARPEK